MKVIVACLIIGAVTLLSQPAPQTAKSAIEQASKAWKENRFDDAERAFLLAADLDPKNPDIQLMLATLLTFQPLPFDKPKERLVKIQRAAAAYRKAIEIDPNPRTISGLANLLKNESVFHQEPVRSQFLNEAETLFRRLLQLTPNDKMTLMALGSMALQKAMIANEQGQAVSRAMIDDGIGKLEKALQLDSEDEAVMYPLVGLYRQRARLQQNSAAKAQDLATASRLEAHAKDIVDRRKEAETNPPFGSYTSPTAYMIKDVRSIRVSAAEQVRKLVTKVDAIYPDEAKQARVQGPVRFSVNIALTGKVSTARLLAGDRLLVRAALTALKQYVYDVTVLNGEGVRVDTEVDVAVVPKP